MKNKLKVLIYLIPVFFMSCPSANNTEVNTNFDSAFESNNSVVVELSRIKFGDFNLELNSYGKAYAKQRVELKFTLNEKINSINVVNGQSVNRGQLIAKQENQIYYNKLVKAKEQLERSKIDVEDILIGFNYSLKNSTNIPDKILNMAQNRSNYNTSTSNLSDAEIELNSTLLRSPISGVVANIRTKKYSYPDLSEPFCTIIDNSIFEVEFEILESDFLFLEKNQSIEIVNDLTQLIINGNISEINPTINENGMVSVKGTFKNLDSGIIDGMNVKIAIKRTLKDKLYVPKESVVLRDNKKVVFTYKNGLAIWNYVTTSFENSKYIVINEGLKLSDSIIYSGNVNLANNSPVVIEN